MQLIQETSVKNCIITVSLETTGFTPTEIKAIEEIGDPIIHYEKSFDDFATIVFDKKLYSGFKIKAKFDGTIDLDLAAEKSKTFIDEIKEELALKMRDVIDKYNDLQVGLGDKKIIEPIKY